MGRTSIGRLACIVALVVSALLIPYAASLAAQKSAGSDGEAKAARLPNYYARVASGQQRTELRAVLKEYAPKIKAKREELQALVAKRDAALDEILTPEQRQEIAKLRADAAARRKAGQGKAKKAKADSAKAKKAA